MFQAVVVVDMPLLFETGASRLTKPRVLIACDEHTQLQRLMARNGLSAEQASARVGSQMPLEAKRRRADVVIDNSGSQDATQKQVRPTCLLLLSAVANLRISFVLILPLNLSGRNLGSAARGTAMAALAAVQSAYRHWRHHRSEHHCIEATLEQIDTKPQWSGMSALYACFHGVLLSMHVWQVP
jgi:hypothetical protein